MKVTVTGTGKTLLTDASLGAVGRVLVHIPASVTHSSTFVGRPRAQQDNGTELMSGSDDVTLSYYTPSSDTLAAAAVTSSPGQWHVKADGNSVYLNVASGTFPFTVYVFPLAG